MEKNLTVPAKGRVSRAKALTIATLALVAPFAASATTGGNTSEILAVFDSYKADAIELSISFAIVLWTLKGTGLLKPRG